MHLDCTVKLKDILLKNMCLNYNIMSFAFLKNESNWNQTEGGGTNKYLSLEQWAFLPPPPPLLNLARGLEFDDLHWNCNGSSTHSLGEEYAGCVDRHEKITPLSSFVSVRVSILVVCAEYSVWLPAYALASKSLLHVRVGCGMPPVDSHCSVTTSFSLRSEEGVILHSGDVSLGSWAAVNKWIENN